MAALAFLFITLAAYRCPPGPVLVVTAGVIASAWVAAWLCLRAVPSVWIDPMATTVAAVTAFAARLFWQSIVSLRALARFVAPEVAQELAATGRLASRHEKEREATVLFADIRGYTDLSEDLAPSEVLRTLNEHFKWMDAIIRAHGGRVDKHVGDAMMAVFTAPPNDHAARAVAAAAALLQGSVTRATPEVRFGIGIHTGILATGTLGSEKAEYAAIGDTVNIAARLESATKELDVPVLVSAATSARLRSELKLLPLGEIALKGKSEPVQVYTLELRVGEGAPVAQEGRRSNRPDQAAETNLESPIRVPPGSGALPVR
jgi:adenylate cyclase